MKKKDLDKFCDENPEPDNCQWCGEECKKLMIHHDHNKKKIT
jgi:hypothetical protein